MFFTCYAVTSTTLRSLLRDHFCIFFLNSDIVEALNDVIRDVKLMYNGYITKALK